MAISDYLRGVRSLVGRRLLLLPGVAAVIRDAEGRVLVQQRADGMGYSLPAGAIDPGEAPAQAVVREVWEETGLSVVPTGILGVFGGRPFRVRYPNGHEAEYTVTVFACEAVDSRPPRPNDDESAALLWVEPARVPHLGLPYPAALYAATGGRPLFAWQETWRCGGGDLPPA